jgi:hypothetical protein
VGNEPHHVGLSYDGRTLALGGLLSILQGQHEVFFDVPDPRNPTFRGSDDPPNKTGTRLFLTLNYAGAAGKVVMFDIARPEYPKVLDVVDLGPGSGPHYLRLTQDEKRLVVSDYFLVEDLAPGGLVHAEGDRKIHVINIHGNRLEREA